MSLALTIPSAASASPVEHHEAGMAAGRQRRADRFGRVGEIDHAHLAARRHDGADWKIAEAHDAGDHFLFTGLEHAGILGFDDQGTDFILADLLAGLAALTQQPQQCLAGAIEQPDGRRRDLRKQRHVRRDPHRHRFRIAQGDLLRHQFADDERRVSDERDDGADADRIRDALRQSELDQQVRQPLAERGAGKCAGQHADQRNADLDRGEKFAGIGCQRQRAARAFDVSSRPAPPAGPAATTRWRAPTSRAGR